MTAVARAPDVHWDDASDADLGAPRPGARLRSIIRGIRQPVAAIIALQALLSLALIWSNTAYIDEADYLWVGRLALRSWLHGIPWPGSSSFTLSGSPVIYPPIGALIDDVGGLAGARILSMLFMLATTVLLYSVTTTIINRRAALFASALWALSEPALRLAFATYDPMSVFLTALSAWLIVQTAYRRHPIVLAVLSVLALALANAAAYSGIVIDPVVVAFAFVVWRPRMGARRALAYFSGFGAALVGGFVLVVVATGSWRGTATIFNRHAPDHQSLTLVLSELWSYSGFLIAFALIGVFIAFRLETSRRASLIAVLGLGVLAVPVGQILFRTAWSADKHVAYSFWFAAMAAGYACARLFSLPAGAPDGHELPPRETKTVRPPSGHRRRAHAPGSSAASSKRTRLVAMCCAVAIIYPAAYGFTSAWQRYHLWPNSAAFITALRPVLAQAPAGLIYVPGHEQNLAQYYLPQGDDWQRWSSAPGLNPSHVRTPRPRKAWGAYYKNLVDPGTSGPQYAVFALFYSSTLRDMSALAGAQQAKALRILKRLHGEYPADQGVRMFTRALEQSRNYKLAAWGPYNIDQTTGTHSYRAFAIWVRVGSASAS
jgi:hypothetical protein